MLEPASFLWRHAVRCWCSWRRRRDGILPRKKSTTRPPEDAGSTRKKSYRTDSKAPIWSRTWASGCKCILSLRECFVSRISRPWGISRHHVQRQISPFARSEAKSPLVVSSLGLGVSIGVGFLCERRWASEKSVREVCWAYPRVRVSCQPCLLTWSCPRSNFFPPTRKRKPKCDRFLCLYFPARRRNGVMVS